MVYYTLSLSQWSGRIKRAWHISRPNGEPDSLRFLQPDAALPRFVRRCPLTMRTIAWLRLFNWTSLLQDDDRRPLGTVAQATYVATFLVKLDAGLLTMGQLHRYLLEHPSLAWTLGFPVVEKGRRDDVRLPSRRQFSRQLTTLDNQVLQQLLDAQVKALQKKLPASFAHIVSLDTKHILAWTKENNPKAYIKEGRFNKEKQATGDPDCKVGCKRRRNIQTPLKEGQPAAGKHTIGEFYWGYASGAVVARVAGVGEFVLAELTQTFDHGDTTFFFPLMQDVERRLGFKPPFGTADAAFDAFYVYDYFHKPEGEGMAVVPFSQPNGLRRHFDDQGLPLCAAGLSMPVRKTYWDRTKAIVPHERAFYACPLLHPLPTGATCPVDHKQWPKGGCSAQMPTSPGTRIRHQLDRDDALFKAVYKERTAVERIFAQAVHLGMERPKLRNQQAITNQNTLIYLLINARALQRLLNNPLSPTDSAGSTP